QTTYSDEQLQAMLAQAPALLRDLLIIYSCTGWRKKSVLQMRWLQVDLLNRWVYLPATATKNRKAAKFPLIQPIDEIFERRRRETDELQRRMGSVVIPWVFHRNGQPVKSIRTAFENMRDRAGLPGHVIHD